MKNLFVTALVVLSANVMAGNTTGLNANSTWEEIMDNEYVEADMPIARMTDGPAAGAVTPVDNLCDLGNVLRTKYLLEDEIIVDSWHDDDDRRWGNEYETVIGYGYVNLVQTYTEHTCVERNNGEDRCGAPYYTVTVEVPKVYKQIPVYALKNVDHNDRDVKRGRLLFKKDLVIPACN